LCKYKLELEVLTALVLVLTWYVTRMYLVCTCTYLFFASEPCFTGFRGLLCDENMLVPDAQQPSADQDIDRGNPCQEDEEVFDRLDAATMEEAISWFMGGMEAQDCGGFKDLHELLGRLAVPTVKPSQSMTVY
jgi:hypothetical protein